MKSAKMSTILVLALGLMVLPASVAEGRQSLTVNGQDVTSITLELGQSCTVEVVSDDSMAYTDVVGFSKGHPVLGTFSHYQTTRAAGDGATVTKYNTKPFYGYLVVARGKFILPRPGVHFIFEYVAQQVGETDVKLYDDTLTSVIDSVRIKVIPLVPEPMGTAFTYQGRLLDADSPADGLYDFEFKLYDNPGPFASQEGNTIDINDLDVIDGQFVVELDFGSDVFAGDARWLEIGVRSYDPCDVNAFTTLSPRQELTPTPYALYAETAGGDNDWMVSGSDMYAIPSGNVGIGTASPTVPLHINRDGDTFDGLNQTLLALEPITQTRDAGLSLKTTRGVDHTWQIRASLGLAGGSNDLYFVDATTGTGFMSIATDGEVGIGSNHVPSAKLHIEQTNAADAFRVDDIAADTTPFIIDQSGNVGIGTTNPLGFKLAVNGSAAKPGGGSWSVYSDRRLKKNIEPLSGALDRMLQLKGVSFEYRDSDHFSYVEGEQIGMIAQEVEKVFPDWVDENGGYKTVTYRGFEAITVEAFRQLRKEKDAEITALKEQLRTQNESFNQRLSALESMMTQRPVGITREVQ